MNIPHETEKQVRQGIRQAIYRGIVIAANGDLAHVRRPEEQDASAVWLPSLDSYTPNATDEVLVVGGVVMGEVTRAPA